MVFIGEDEQFGRYAAHTSGIKGTHALSGVNTIILLTVDAEDGRIPAVDKSVGRMIVGAAGGGGAVFIPVGVLILPIGEPILFGFGVHRLEVESSVVRDESFKTFVVMPGEIVDAEPTETGPDTTQSIFVDKRQIIGSIVHGGEIVAHTETGPVARDFFIPFRSEARQTAAIGSNDDVVVSSHYLEIPTVAPKLTHGTLRSALTEE